MKTRRWETKVAACLLAGLVACGGEETKVDEPKPAEPEPVACDGRFDELSPDGVCGMVSVIDVVTEPVTFERDGYTMHGVLTLPVTAGEHRPAAVVIVHGSGPHGADGVAEGSLGVMFGESIAVYRSLAEQLAWRGVASLRYEKRSCFSEAVEGCVNSLADYPGDIDAIMVDDFVEDARAAALSLAARPELRPGDVLVAGHSQGGSYVPHLVASEATITGGIGLAAMALPLVDTLAGQIEGYADHLEALNGLAYASQISELRALAAQYRDELTQVLAGTWPSSKWLGAPTPFWQSFATWAERPATDLAATDEPILYVSGDQDFNVWPEHVATYESYGFDNVSTQLFAGVTHAFVPIDGTPPADHTVAEPGFSSQVADTIVGWMAQ